MRSIPLQLVLLACVPMPRAVAATDAPSAPNVVFILVDDASTELGTYGHPVAATPNLDRLAARGTVFRAAYCPSTLCNPSRISILSGQTPAHTGILNNQQLFHGATLNGVALLPRQFRDHGYHVGGVGKILHDHFFEPSSWDESHDLGDDPGIQKPAHPSPADGWRVVYWGPFLNGVDGSLGSMKDTRNTDLAVDMLRRLPEPYFLAVGYTAPHNPLIYPEAYGSLYDPALDVAPLPPEESSTAWRRGVPARAYHSEMFLDPAWQTDPEGGRREAAVAYWRTLRHVDTEVGRLLDALEAQGQLDRTILVFTSDHGWSGGLHGRYGKKDLFEESARVPLMIAVPGLPSGECSSPVQLLDLYPTLMELCGLPRPEGLDGHSLLPVLRQPAAARDSLAIGQLERQQGEVAVLVRSTRYKYVYWPKDGAWQLYDLQQDPGEYDNLRQYGTFNELRRRMHEAMIRAGGFDCPARWTAYGQGLGGRTGVPSLWSNAAPRRGSTILVQVGNSAGAATFGLEILGFQPAARPLWGGHLLLEPSFLIPFVVPRDGLILPLAVPDDPLACGAAAYMQWALFDPAAPQRMALTHGLEFVIGD